MAHQREENNIGLFLGLVLAFFCWIVGIALAVRMPFPALDQFRLVRDLGGDRLVVSIIFGAFVGLLCFLFFRCFASPTCVGISLITGYISGGILGLTAALALAWGVGYWSGLDARALMLIMALCGFEFGADVAGSAALENWEKARAVCYWSLLIHGGIMIGWLAGSASSVDTQILYIACGVGVAIFGGLRLNR